MKGNLLYEGKAKQVFNVVGEEEKLILSYKNDATAFNGKKKESFVGKGRYNNLISAKIFNYLHEKGIPTHFEKGLNETEQLVKKTTIIPLEVVVRRIAAGSITRRLPIKEKTPFIPPLVELFFKDDVLDDPLVNDDHALLLTDVTKEELQMIKETAVAIGEHLADFFYLVNLSLVDFKLEFGRTVDGQIVLSDEISPDTCRLWDVDTGEKMDKDVFREDLGDLMDVYNKILARLEEI
ncbi:phosphoribosylaminoimidazolesuccinocarboxamide synthase [Aquibacillus sp. 3ASR75-11]|uniref:Phosphoribosylaminoimidazole-succinocarboxamide synthase n=1 Tax=Terrihalobacillus insolitus TaxID=2950438 RepID=A0A9X4APC4_9BACI|nr:phosphoribosylaminoimidazolesuccinocarboxamide synthase [Terrihalobacillus insolitus]MDC3414202.1 phosphoribosylaminoimidazolesuccinocarboxamide synthase [Terrihalobacillus insolitus]MDC3425408.1 phosphoribosylaminoimidazolesuccinocarboxamide synthase [Terrihalobacillus insolitus]